MQKSTLALSMAFFAGVSLWGQAPQGSRVWTDVAGRTVEAEYAGMQGDNVLLKLASSGQTVPVPLARLSAPDAEYLKKLPGFAAPPAQAQTAPALPNDPARVPVEKRTWPQTIDVPARSIEIKVISESVAQRRYVYQSEAFEFTSQAKLAGSVMKEVARAFEATRALVNALPWGIVCRPPEGMPRFQAALYESREDYVTAGGPANSGGVYSSGDKTFKIPFPSLGLEKRGQTYFKNDSYSNSTLVHEITHQLMDAYLLFLPMWVIEGTAEYTQMLPYKAGTFRADSHKSALKNEADQWQKNGGYNLDLGSLQAHLTMTREQWQTEASNPAKMSDLYHRSQLLTYYFCHLDGDASSKGARFIRYMEAVYGEVAAVRAFFADSRVKRLEGGRFSYPSDMTPPDMSGGAVFKHLPVLIDERSYEKLAAEITEGFKSMGMKVQVTP